MAAKDVMMSKRATPMDHVDASMYAKSAQQSAPQQNYQPPPISNYKGVMLCDRPIVKADTVAARGEVPPFACTVGPSRKFEQVGLNPSREERSAKIATDGRVSAKSSNDFLSKHRTWLRKYSDEKKKQSEDDVDFARRAEEKRQKFKEYSSKLRATIRDAKAEAGITEDMLSGRSTSRSGRKDKEKPAWAMTEEQVENKEEKEVEDLLHFAAGLDYDKYIQDYEVKQALSIIKDRISELNDSAGEQQQEQVQLEGDKWQNEFVDKWNKGDAHPGDSHVPAPQRLNTARSQPDRERYTSRGRDAEEQLGQERPDTSKSAQAEANLRKIHSSASIRNIIENQTQRRGRSTLTAVAEEVDVGPLVAPPTTTIYHPEDLGYKAQKKEVDVSNLPYLHRNPAI